MVSALPGPKLERERLLVLGAGYIGAALAQAALARGHELVLADNWYATERGQLAALEQAGARVETADIRRRSDLDALLGERPARVYFLAAQASRPLSESDPDYTEETNVTGARRVAEAAGAAGGVPVLYASSLHVYGPSPRDDISPNHPYGPQSDLAHLSKIYAELCLRLYARRHGFALAIYRLGIVYGRSPVDHERPESQTVVDRFRRLAAQGKRLPLDDGGRATIGTVHVDDVARIMLDWRGETVTANVAADTVTVADVAALATGAEPPGGASCSFGSPFVYRHAIADYLRA